MLTQTTELAIRALLVIALEGDEAPWTPKRLAERLTCSETYLGKTLGLLVKAGVLSSVRGARGGVRLAQRPESISLLTLVEACQGVIVGSYCTQVDDLPGTCSFHVAMHEVRQALLRTLSKWSLADLIKRPLRCGVEGDGLGTCRMLFVGGERFAGTAASHDKVHY